LCSHFLFHHGFQQGQYGPYDQGQHSWEYKTVQHYNYYSSKHCFKFSYCRELSWGVGGFRFVGGTQSRNNQKQFHILLAGEKKKTARESLLVWLYLAGAVTAMATDQNKVTIPEREMGKGWRNFNITTEHCP
jgi:hypothetical protein